MASCSMKKKKKGPLYLITLSLYLRFRRTSLHDLVPSLQFKKHEKHPWRSANYREVAGFSLEFTKGTLLHGCFYAF